MADFSADSTYNDEAIRLYLQLEFPKFQNFISKMLSSPIRSKWFIPLAFSILFFWKTSTAGKYFLLENRRWIKKSYLPEDLAPFYPQTGDLPTSELNGSLKNLTVHVNKYFETKSGQSYSKIKYWLSQDYIPPAIVLAPSLSRTPFSKAKGIILDGNHRAIAMALKGELIRSYAGILASEKDPESNKESIHKIEYAQKYFRDSQVQDYKHGLQTFRDHFITVLEMKLIKTITSQFLQPSKVKHLDIATGSGRIISQLESFFNESIGLDTSKQMMASAKSKTKLSSFLRADSENLPFMPHSFSIITCFRLFINLSTTGRKNFLLDCKRIIADNGILVVDNHCNKISPTGILGSLRCKLTTNNHDPFKLYSLLTPFQFDHELQSNGFSPIARLCSFSPSLSHVPISEPLKMAIDTCLGKLPIIRSFADLIMVVSRKK